MAKVLEILPLAVVPLFLIKKSVLNPLRKQTGGTVLVSLLHTICMYESACTINIQCNL